jgi:hypothetical protein
MNGPKYKSSAKWTQAQDDAYDKKHGIKEDSKRDKAQDTMHGIKDKAGKKKPLTTKSRNNLPTSAFALPGRKYPIHNKAHARNALARVAQNGTSTEKAIVRRKVKARFPDIA